MLQRAMPESTGTGGTATEGVHIGTSGWSYGHWEKVLYPRGTAPSARLGVYARSFDTVELNASFYPGPAARHSPDGDADCQSASCYR